MRKILSIAILLLLVMAFEAWAGDQADVIYTDGSHLMTGALNFNVARGATILSRNGSAVATVGADGILSGGRVCYIFTTGAGLLDTGQTSGVTLTPSGVTGVTSIPQIMAGKIVGLSISVGSAVTAGQITATAVRLGYAALTGASVTLSATNNSGLRNWKSTAGSFNAGDALGIQYTSSNSPALTGAIGQHALILLCVTQ